MKHLVGAALSMLRDRDGLIVDGFKGDNLSLPVGDFRIKDMVIYVNSMPEWPLLYQCFENLDQGLRPLVISTNAGAAQVEALADEVGMGNRIEALDITQFLVSCLYEWTGFDGTQLRQTFDVLINRYNALIEECEADPSIKIEVA